MGVFFATTIWFLASFTTPVPYVFCRGQAAGRAFDTGTTWGLAAQNIPVAAVPEVRYGCVVT